MNQTETNPLATKLLEAALHKDGAGSIEGLDFKRVEDYTTFTAEYAFDGDDIVFHFFLPKEFETTAVTALVRRYWEKIFPSVLEPTVFDVFKAQPPRLQAAFVGDLGLDSWWLKAFGFANHLDPESLCDFFLRELDSRLDAVKSK